MLSSFEEVTRVRIEKEYFFNAPSVQVRVRTWKLMDKGYKSNNSLMMEFDRSVSNRNLVKPTAFRHIKDFRIPLKNKRVGNNYGKGEDVARFVTGNRIKTLEPGLISYDTGTVVGYQEKGPKNLILVCMDKPHMTNYRDADNVCGKGYGRLTDPKCIRLMHYTKSERNYQNVPNHVGVFLPGEHLQNGVLFPAHSLGRIICLSAVEPGMATVSWFNFRGLAKDRLWKQDTRETVFPNCFNVPYSELNWCTFDLETYKVTYIWRITDMGFKEGDYLVYIGAKSIPVMSVNKDTVHSYFLTKGAILRHGGWDSARRVLVGYIAGGMPKETWGTKFNFRKTDVRKLKEIYIQPEKEVKVSTKIMFKKNNLQGRVARVILPTDEDGDIGVEFPEDISAGSLDGAGKQGCCLYIPASAVKETSE